MDSSGEGVGDGVPTLLVGRGGPVFSPGVSTTTASLPTSTTRGPAAGPGGGGGGGTIKVALEDFRSSSAGRRTALEALVEGSIVWAMAEK